MSGKTGSGMKVALARYRYSPYGGAERYLDALAAGLLAMGAQVRLLCSAWEGVEAAKVPLERIAVPDLPVTMRLFRFAREVRRWTHRNPEWLLFSLDRVPGAEVYRAGDGCHAEWLLRKRILRPVSWPLDYLRPLHRSYLSLERTMFASERLRAVIANSERGKGEILRRFGVPEEKVRVIYNGVDLGRYHPGRREEAGTSLRKRLGVAENEPVFLFVGSGFERKGVGFLTRAAVNLAGKGARFRVVVVGKGSARRYLREAGEGGKNGGLLFTGPVAGAEEFFHGADAFVFPTIYEPFSNACLEAMAAGLPVITTVVNGVSEILKDGESGFLLEDPADAETLAERMEKLLSSDLRKRMGAKARNVAEAFPLERNLRETLGCLARVWEERALGPW
jgi:UDP-glucose:(heptosyl)LPS alpha-1,3-glucosyltransferase